MILYTGLFDDDRLLVVSVVGGVSRLVGFVSGVLHTIGRCMVGDILCPEITGFCVLFVDMVLVV